MEIGYTQITFTYDEMKYLSECWHDNKGITSTVAMFLERYPCDQEKLVWCILFRLEKIMKGEPFWPLHEVTEIQETPWTSTNQPPQK